MSDPLGPLESARALLRFASNAAGCPLALVSTTGRVMLWAGTPPSCGTCPGPLEPGCRLLAARDACRTPHEFVSVPVPAHPGVPLNLVAMLPADTPPEGRRMRQPELAGFLQELGNLVAATIRERAELELMSLELSTRYEELNLIYGVGERLARGGHLHDVLKYILEESMSTTSAQWALLHMPRADILEVDGWAGDKASDRDGSALRALAGSIADEVTAGDEPLTAAKQSQQALSAILGTPAVLLAVPIRRDGEMAGFLAVAHLSGDAAFSTSDVRLLQALAEQVALVASNWELHASLREFLMSTVRSLVSAIDAKDAYTRGHSERVHRLSLLLADSMGLGESDYETLRWASLLHDIGKLGVPESILGKPGKLTEEEFAVMKRHPDRSVEIISHIAQLAPALDGIRHHHERWDGSGYPCGLSGEEIPLLARIISVADTFDALTSTRAYRGALPPEEVREYILGAAGRHLDPGVVAVFDRAFPALLPLVESKPNAAPLARVDEDIHVRDANEDRAAHADHPVPAAG